MSGDFPIGRIVLGPSNVCGDPNCVICERGWGFPVRMRRIYQTPTQPDTGPVVDFTDPVTDYTNTLAEWKKDYAEFKSEQPMSNTERVTDLEIEVQNLRAAVLDLTKVAEYLLIWTGKKGNKQDRDKYLDGYIDPIRVIL